VVDNRLCRPPIFCLQVCLVGPQEDNACRVRLVVGVTSPLHSLTPLGRSAPTTLAPAPAWSLGARNSLPQDVAPTQDALERSEGCRSDTECDSRQSALSEALSSGMAPSSSGYLRLKRYRERRSLEREQMYLAHLWPPGSKHWNAHQWAAVKRWYIYYDRRRQEREVGHRFQHQEPRHWVGPLERERERAKLTQPSCNLVVVRHLLRF